MQFQNIFWEVRYLDPYKATSFDKLHANGIGVFGDHIWSEFQRVVDDGTRYARKEIDRQ